MSIVTFKPARAAQRTLKIAQVAHLKYCSNRFVKNSFRFKEPTCMADQFVDPTPEHLRPKIPVSCFIFVQKETP